MTASTNRPIDYDPLSRSVQNDPYPYYRRLLMETPVYHNPDLEIWALSRYVDVQTSLRDWKTFSSAEGVNLEPGFTELIGPEILNMDPPRHDLLRRVIRNNFTRSTVRGYEEMVRSFAKELLDPLIRAGGGDFAADFSHRLPVLVICELMGIPLADEKKVRHLAADMLLYLSGTEEYVDTATAAGHELREYFGHLVEVRREVPQDDTISALANAEIDGKPLLPEEIFGMCLIIYLAGNTTTSSLISNGLYVLACHPSQKALLAANLGEIEGGVEELLRFESPVQWSSRVTTRDIELHGTVIPEGARVMMLIGAAHRDAQQWREPDKLDVLRVPKPHLAFAEGVHLCIGAPLARLEGQIALKMVLSQIPDYQVAGEVERLYISTERGLARLPLSISG